MSINLLCFVLTINLFIVCIVCKDKPIVSFNVYERDDSFGQYFANLFIPSLQIRAESNLTFNKNNELTDNYKIELRVDEPMILDAIGDLNISIDTQLMAKVFDISLKSRTFSHLNTRSRSLVRNTEDERTFISTNCWFEDNLNNMSANYNMTYIGGNTCPTITLYHNLTTNPNSLLYFSSNVTEICDLVHNSSQMAINISLESNVWQLANGELKQRFNFGKNDGSESMNATHPLMDVSVIAYWDRSAKLMHFKKAIFSSKAKHFIPSFELEFRKYRDIANQVLINIMKEVPKILNNIEEDNPRDEL